MKNFKEYIQQRFRAVTSPQQLMNDADFVKMFNDTYYSIFHVYPKIYSCGVCMFEHYKELEQLTEDQIKFRLSMKNNMKEGIVHFASNGRPYSRKSPEITQEILDELQAKYPNDFEPVEVESTPEPEEPVIEQPVIVEFAPEPEKLESITEPEHHAIKPSKRK